MKNLIIIGAGSYGREIYNLAMGCIGYGTDFTIKGFIDNLYEEIDKEGYPPILGKVGDYMPVGNDVFICALMDVDVKKKYIDIIVGKGGSFINLIHKTASIWQNTKIGKGCIICNSTHLSCDIEIGNFVTIQPMSVLGHDVIVKDYCHLNAFSFLGGKVFVNEMVTINTGAIILPGIEVGKHSIIGAGSVVLRRVKENVTMFGNPAKILSI